MERLKKKRLEVRKAELGGSWRGAMGIGLIGSTEHKGPTKRSRSIVQLSHTPHNPFISYFYSTFENIQVYTVGGQILVLQKLINLIFIDF